MTKLTRHLVPKAFAFLLLCSMLFSFAAPAYAEEVLPEVPADGAVSSEKEAPAEEPAVEEPATEPSAKEEAASEPVPETADGTRGGSDGKAAEKNKTAGSTGSIESAGASDSGLLTPGSAEENYDEVYVAAYGDDEQGTGSIDAPFATLARAAEAANASSWNTVYVCLLTDLESAETARFYGKQIYLLGENDQVTVTRRLLFKPEEDDIRGVYNPAMIEAGMPASPEGASEIATSLTLENVILDDAGIHEGDIFRLPIINVENKQINKNTVQEAVIAAYGSTEVTLRESSVLQNYGGMSAVRVTEGASLYVENGAVVQDTEKAVPVAGTSEFLSDDDSFVTVEEYAIVVPRGEEAAAAEADPATALEEESETESEASSDADLTGEESGSEPQLAMDGTSEPEESKAIAAEGESQTARADALQAAASSEEGFVTLENDRDYITEDEMTGDLEIPYTIRLAFPSLIAASESQISAFDLTVTVTIDNRLAFKETDGAVLTADTDHSVLSLGEVAQEGNTLTAEIVKNEGTGLSAPFALYFTAVLPEASFEAGESLAVNAEAAYDITFSISGTDIPVSNSEMSALNTQMLVKGSATIHYDANGGSNAPADKTDQPQDNYALDTETIPTHSDVDGKKVLFLGWTAEKTTQIFAHGDPAPATLKTVTLAPEGTTVYAAYGYDEFGSTEGSSDGTADISQTLLVLSFDPTGGENAPASQGKAPTVLGTRSFEIPETEPSRTGFAFQGWSETDGGEAKYRYNKDGMDHDIVISQDTALYAVWLQVANYVVNFDANGGSGAPASVARVTRIIQLPDETPTRSGYVFQGWAKSKTATTAEYKAGSLYTADAASTTLYAVWREEGSIDPVDPAKKITYTLYYNANGGQNAPAAQSGQADADGVVHLNITYAQPTRSGYVFKGWATTRRGDASYFAGEKVRISGGDVTLFAVWERDASNGRAPKTGDESNIPLYIALLVVSLAAIVFLIRILRKRKHK